jgi:hypothetical protein
VAAVSPGPGADVAAVSPGPGADVAGRLSVLLCTPVMAFRVTRAACAATMLVHPFIQMPACDSTQQSARSARSAHGTLSLLTSAGTARSRGSQRLRFAGRALR